MLVTCETTFCLPLCSLDHVMLPSHCDLQRDLGWGIRNRIPQSPNGNCGLWPACLTLAAPLNGTRASHDWNTITLNSQGQEIDNREMMKRKGWALTDLLESGRDLEDRRRFQIQTKCEVAWSESGLSTRWLRAGSRQNSGKEIIFKN